MSLLAMDRLTSLFKDLAVEGDVSMRMDSSRGGLSLQVSKRDWDEEKFFFIVANNTGHQYFKVRDDIYSWVVTHEEGA